MTNWRDHKRQARRDIHSHMGVPAVLLPTRDATPIPVTIRGPWTKRPISVGDLAGGGEGWAQRENTAPRILFYRDQIPATLMRGSIVSVEAGEAYRIATTEPANDETITADVVPLSAEEADGLPLPETGVGA